MTSPTPLVCKHCKSPFAEKLECPHCATSLGVAGQCARCHLEVAHDIVTIQNVTFFRGRSDGHSSYEKDPDAYRIAEPDFDP